MTATTVLLAGGLGSRMDAVTGGRLPKVLLDVGGRPFLDRKLDELAADGVSDVVVLAGHGGEQVREHLRRHPYQRLSVVVHDDGEKLLGTGGAIAASLGTLPELFWVTYGDSLLDVAMAPLERLLRPGDGGLLTVVRNEDHIQPSNTSVAGGRVTAYGKGDPPGTHTYLDYGLGLFRRRAFEPFTTGQVFDLGLVLRSLIERRALAAAVVDAEFHDIGTPEAWRQTSGRYQSR